MKIASGLACTASLFFLCAGMNAAAQTKPEAGAPESFHTVKEILDLVPKETLKQLKVPGKGEAARKSANQLLAQKALRKNATFKVKTLNWLPWKHELNPDKIHVLVPQQFVDTGGSKLPLNLWVTVADDKDPGLAKSTKGQEITLAGQLVEVEFRINPTNPSVGLEFHVNLGHCKVERR